MEVGHGHKEEDTKSSFYEREGKWQGRGLIDIKIFAYWRKIFAYKGCM